MVYLFRNHGDGGFDLNAVEGECDCVVYRKRLVEEVCMGDSCVGVRCEC